MAARSPSSGGYFDVDHKRLKIEELDSIAAKPSFWDDQKKAQSLLKEKKSLEQIVTTYDAQLRALSDAEVLLELLLVAKHGLRLLLVVPEVRTRRDRIELLDLQPLVIDVKVTSGALGP